MKQTQDYVKIHEGPWSGCVHADYASVPLEKLLSGSADSSEKVTSSDTAEVYRYALTVEGRSQMLYLKKYPHRSRIDQLQCLIRPSRASRAFAAATLLEANALDTPKIAAFLQKKDGLFLTEDILITEEMQNATALQSVLNGPTAISEPDKRRMIVELGQTIGRMHAAGIIHGDMRGGNVFTVNNSGQWQFIFIDNERTVRYAILPFWLRRKNLVQLNIHRENLSATDRMRFLCAYRQAAGMSRKASKRLGRIILKKTAKRLAYRAKTRTGIAGGSDSAHWDFQKAQRGDCGGIFLADFAKADIAAKLLEQIETLTAAGEVLKNDVSTRVVRSEYNGRDIVIKRYNHQGLWHSIRHTIKGSRAKKCWKFGHLLTAAGIANAAPLGVIEQRQAGIVRQSYIINAFVEGPLLYVPMNDPACSQEQRQAIVSKAQRVLERLGENLMTHSDMKSANLIIHDGEPVLIDLDSMRQHRPGPYFRSRYEKMVRTFHRRLSGGK